MATPNATKHRRHAPSIPLLPIPQLAGSAAAGLKSPSRPEPPRRPSIFPEKEKAPLPLTKDEKTGASMIVDPDDAFRKMTVGEVKRLEGKLSTAASTSRQTLRLLVGARYRDLLSSSHALSTLSSSSQQLSMGLSSIRAKCQHLGDDTQTAGQANEDNSGETEMPKEDVLRQAAYTKLLLDAPETLWRFLERSEYLEAAFLWLLCRTVTHVTSTPEQQQTIDEDLTSSSKINLQPLLSKLHLSLPSFKTEISTRAITSLRSTSLSAIDLSRATAAIVAVGLGGLGLPEALDAVLKERAKVLSGLVDAAANSGSGGVGHGRGRSGSVISVGEGSKSQKKVGFSDRRASNASLRSISLVEHTEKEVERVFLSLVEILGSTLHLSRQVFAPTSTDDNKSLIERLIELLEAGEVPTVSDAATTIPESNEVDAEEETDSFDPTHTTPTRKGHKRRVSRLASISMPFAYPAPVFNRSVSSSSSISFPAAKKEEVNDGLGEHITTVTLLKKLPSSAILLRYLPAEILSFTPLLHTPNTESSPSPSLDVNVILTKWLSAQLTALPSRLTEVLSHLVSVQSLSRLRVSVLLSLDSCGMKPEEVASVKTVFEDLWKERLKYIWSTSMETIKSDIQSSVKKGLEEENSADSTTKSVAEYTFATPSVLPASSSNFPLYKSQLGKKVHGRTPGVDKVLQEVERWLVSVDEDLKVLKRDVGGKEEEKMVGEMWSSLGSWLGSFVKDDDSGEVASEIFVGRVSLHLSSLPAFSGIALAEELNIIYKKSLVRWRQGVVEDAVKCIFSDRQRIAKGKKGVNVGVKSLLWKAVPENPSLLLPTSPSRSVLTSLQNIVSAILKLGLPPASSSDSTVPELLQEFTKSVVALPNWNGMAGEMEVTQSLWDVMFLKQVCGSDEEWSTVQKDLLAKSAEMLSIDQQTLTAAITKLIGISLLRIQTILNPLLSAPISTKDNVGNLLRLGTPSVSTEYESPLALVSPSQRFGLCSVQSISMIR